jgi:SpoVK/Ycf46/Vps4 family AAA+-type ATPase
VLVSPLLSLPPELEKDVTVLDVPLPDAEEIAKIMDGVLESVRGDDRVRVDLSPTLRERMLQAALGLTATEAESIFCKAVVEGLRLDEQDLDLILAEKKQIIRKGGLLEFYELDESLEHVGGIATLKVWLDGRGASFSARARAFGLPEPRGLLLLGVQGCGKSLTAKAIASHWRLPLLRMDVGNVFSSYMGASEENMRRSIRTAESLSPCVLWLDELEKAFAGASGSGDLDSGTTRRVFATFLTWMQEKTRPVFVVATANSIDSLPPELLRKGRFDEIFFLDLPDLAARRAIFSIHLERRRRNPTAVDLDALARATEGFSGAEIEEVVVAALYRAFGDGERELSSDDLLAALAETVPLSVTMREPIAALRTWAKDRARSAS